ncbi:GAF domain-containing protein [Acetobacteraceae bacterium]|nr:GAF domain-containing protein [Acetobacteraceae bacterium]
MSTAPLEKMKLEDLPLMAKGLISNETDEIALLANLSALIFETFDGINWAGFYRLLSSQELVLGPFQGRIACTRIALGKGVCGTSASQRKTFRIENVHEFEGHIACDSASNSEIVIPILGAKQLYGVLDIDSPNIGRFSETDQTLLEEIVSELAQRLDQLSNAS